MQHLSTDLLHLRIEQAKLHIECSVTKLQHADDFDDVRHAGSGLGVADISLDSAHKAWPFVVVSVGYDGRNRTDFDWIAQRCPSSVGFHRAPGFGRRIGQSGPNQKLLRSAIERSECRALTVVPSR